MTLQGIRLATYSGLQRAISSLQSQIIAIQQQIALIPPPPDLSPYVQDSAFSSAIEGLVQALDDLQDAIEKKSNSNHIHQASAIEGLTNLLDGKANQVDLSGLASRFANHTHTIPGIEGLANALNSKADSNHTHTQYLLASSFDTWKASTVTFAGVSTSGTFAHTTLNGGKVGFFGATPSGKPSVTGTRQGNAALGSLLRGLANLGLITDNTVG